MANPGKGVIGRSRVALLAGFGGLLLVMALSGADAVRVLGRVRREDDRIRRQFLLRNHLLNDIRSELYLSGTWVRDYLLEPDAARAVGFGNSLENIHREMDTALASYSRQIEPGESREYDELRAEIARYWDVLGPVLTWTPEERARRGYAFLRDDVFPRRAAMLEIAGRIADVNEQQLNAGNARVADLLDSFRDRLLLILFVGLALGAGTAIFTARRILRLEREAEARFAEVSEARAQLATLPARLIEAQETERRNLARELHDEVGQSLSAVLLELRSLENTLGGNRTEPARALIDSTLKVVRNMSLLLRPSMLDDIGLVPALKWQAREVSRRTAIDVTVSADLDSEDLPEDHKTCIYRVVQEALNNSIRHSGARAIKVDVRRSAHSLRLSIADNGCGFDPGIRKGLGLLGIEERVSLLGGHCHVDSSPGRGTTVSVDLPFESSGEPLETHSHTARG